MKRKFLNFSLMASIGLLAFSVVGCGDSYGANYSGPQIVLSDEYLEMNVGETKRISVSVEKAYASAPVRWFTSNQSVAYFRDNSRNYVTAVGEGEAIVTVSIAGGYADCRVVVGSGSVDPDAPRFTLQSTASVEIGASLKLSYSVNPVGSTISFTSDAPDICGVDGSGNITGVAKGSATITGVASSAGNPDITRYCTVNVTEGGGGGGGGDLDIGLPDSVTGLTGSLVVGTPDNSRSTMEALCNAFNTKTGSNVSFSFTKFEEDKGAGNFPTGAASGPDIFPYVSDQTMTLNNLGALSPVEKDVYKKYRTTMLDGAVEAATWNDNVLGYPFAADNGVVMFYDKAKVNDPSEIDTVDKLFAKAQASGLSVAYALTNGFYAASMLHTFSNGESMFEIESSNTGYTSSSHFNCDAGLKGIKLGYQIMDTDGFDVAAGQAPGQGNILATIIDTSRVREFKATMGDRYGVAPLPFVNENRTERICSYLGYKFYGVNGVCTNKTLANYVARFLVSEYAQNYRFEKEKTQSTLKSLQTVCSSEPHVAALNAQRASGSTLLLSIFGDEYFDNTSKTFLTLLNDYWAEGKDPTEAQYVDLLRKLDNSWA